jgi:hypothetical protein
MAIGQQGKIIKTHKYAAGGYPDHAAHFSHRHPARLHFRWSGWPLFSTAATRQIEKACADRLPPHG